MIKIIFDGPGDAYRILDITNSCIRELGRISVDILYGICCCWIPDEEDCSKGWTDISDVKIVHENDGYAMHLPDPINVKELHLNSFEFTKWFGDYRYKTGI